MNMVKADGKDASLWGLPPRPMFDQKVVAGRWFTAGEESGERCRDRDREEHRQGDRGRRRRHASRSRPRRARRTLRVVGMTGTQMENGLLFLTPLSTLRAILHSPDNVNAYWVRTSSPEHGLIDRTTTALEDRLAAGGYSVGTNIRYVDQARNVDANRQISSAIGILGFLIVAISHGRARQRDHDERARADAGDRRPPLHRRTRPGHPADLRRRGPDRLAARVAARHPGRLRAGTAAELAAARGRQDRVRLHLPAAERARSRSSERSCSRC